jgi:hypothetical protein
MHPKREGMELIQKGRAREVVAGQGVVQLLKARG